MSVAAALSVMAAALGLYVAALSRRFRRAPGWSDQGWFSLVALTGSLFVLCNAVTYSAVPDLWAVQSTRIQLLIGALHLAAWIRYTAAYLCRPPDRLDRALFWLLPLLGLGALAPGAYLSGAVQHRSFPPLGVVYAQPDMTPLGGAVMAALLSVFLLLMGRFAAARWRGTPRAGVHLVSLGALFAMGVNDALALASLIQTPYLLDLGLIVPLAAVGYALTDRFVEDARALEELRLRLESQVAERTRELAESQETLMRAEKLMALGQFSAGVAHEINSPAAVVSANLRYLSECAKEQGRLPEDGLDCLAESGASMERIGRIVRQLVDASRIAAFAKQPDQSMHVAGAVAAALDAVGLARGRPVEAAVAPDLCALGEEQMLARVLANLLANAAQAIPLERTDAHIRVSAERVGDRIRIVVEDNGTGMAPETLRRASEPFFSTKPAGAGLGLGLAVSRGLVASLRGELRLESERGVGTRAIVELPAAAPPTRDGASSSHGPLPLA